MSKFWATTVISQIARIRGWVGGDGVGGGGRCRLYLSIGLFGAAMNPRSASRRPIQDWKALRDVSPTQGWISNPYLLFGVAMSPRSANHRPRQDWRALRDVSPTQGWISDPYLPSSALHGSHCLSRDFTQSAKPALEKQTDQLSPLMQQCMDSA